MSGIYIPGMVMPKNCHECCFEAEGYFCRVRESMNTNSDEWLSTQYYDDVKGRPDWCPLVPVPPHGRLIDADRLGIRDAEKQAYEAYLREKGEFFVEEPLLEYMRGRLDGITDASGRVRFAPTIIPASKEGTE